MLQQNEESDDSDNATLLLTTSKDYLGCMPTELILHVSIFNYTLISISLDHPLGAGRVVSTPRGSAFSVEHVQSYVPGPPHQTPGAVNVEIGPVENHQPTAPPGGSVGGALHRACIRKGLLREWHAS